MELTAGRGAPGPGSSDEAVRRAVTQTADAAAFGQLVEPYRRELKAHCYRILGSLHEAEDQVQETLLRAWRRRETYAGRASLRAWLYKIATNACLDALDKRRARRWLPPERGAAADPAAPLPAPAADTPWLEPYPDEWLPDVAESPEARYTQRESVTLAFLAALQGLPPRQRAALLLSDVLDWPARDVAELLEISPGAVSSLLFRARATLERHYHRREPAVAIGQADHATRQLLERYVRAWETADVRGLVALMKEDAVLAMPPAEAWYSGRASVGAFMAQTVLGVGDMFPGPAEGRWRLVACAANGEAGFGLYLRTPEGGYQAMGVSVVSLAEAGVSVAGITSFLDPSLPERFGLPATLSN